MPFRRSLHRTVDVRAAGFEIRRCATTPCKETECDSYQPLKVLTPDKYIAIASHACGVAIPGLYAQVLPPWIAAPKPPGNKQGRLGLVGQNLYRPVSDYLTSWRCKGRIREPKPGSTS